MSPAKSTQNKSGNPRRTTLAAAPKSSPIPIIIGVGIFVVIIGIVVGWMFMRPLPGQDKGALPATRFDSHIVDNVGPDAPTLVEFLDLQCNACASLDPTVQQLREQYAGQINYVVRQFPLEQHQNAMAGALAVEAAAQQNRIEDMIQRLFATQPQWESLPDASSVFRGYASDLGLDLTAYDATIADPATTARIERDYQDGVALGVKGTPTFILDGKVLTLSSLSDLTDPIDAAIAKASKK